MEKIIIQKRTNKGKKDSFQLRFRLRDGRAVDLFYKSDIKATLEKLDKFKPDGELRDGVKVYDAQLKADMDKTIGAIKAVYGHCKEHGVTLDSARFAELVNERLHPERVERAVDETLLGQFSSFYAQYLDSSPLVFRDYQVLDGKLTRYLKITGRTAMLPKEFTARDLEDFHKFMVDEYKFAAEPRYGKFYEDMLERNIPKKARSQNTVATEIKKLRTFFKWYAAQHDDYGKTPFERLSDTKRKELTSEDYDDAVCLTKDEFIKVLDTEVPPTLQEAKDVFLLQCNFGARIEDFRKRRMDDVMVDESGIPYLRYLPHKTLKKSKDDIETPILRYSLDIIKKYRFDFPVLKYITGHNGYNHKIKELLKHCGIDRGCKVYNAETEANDLVPLYERASSKLCRKTFVDMMNKAQIDEYAAGLHKKGSEAVRRYTNMGLQDRFKLMCFAFGQPIYAVDKDLNVVEVERDELDELQRKADELKRLVAERTAEMPKVLETMKDVKAWSKAMAEVTAYNQQLNELNSKIIVELRKRGV